MKIKKIILPCIMVSYLASNYLYAQQKDATQEINILNNEDPHRDTITEQVVLGNFANIVQNFFSIVQNPHNIGHVGANISQMLAGIINVAVEVMKNAPSDIYSEDHAVFIQNLEISLKESLRALTLAKKRRLKVPSQL